jgi:hypothetical protein
VIELAVLDCGEERGNPGPVELQMEHPAADHAKAIMQVAAAGTGVPICDGSTKTMLRSSAAGLGGRCRG